jgi:hypothetical protein
MIPVPAVRVPVATKPIDFRKGGYGLRRGTRPLGGIGDDLVRAWRKDRHAADSSLAIYVQRDSLRWTKPAKLPTRCRFV